MSGRIFWKDGAGLYAGASDLGLQNTINVKTVSVPADFVGITSHRWPVIPSGLPDCAPPLFSFGSLRTHDSSG